jgi:hypothetical protein
MFHDLLPIKVNKISWCMSSSSTDPKIVYLGCIYCNLPTWWRSQAQPTMPPFDLLMWFSWYNILESKYPGLRVCFAGQQMVGQRQATPIMASINPDLGTTKLDISKCIHVWNNDLKFNKSQWDWSQENFTRIFWW